MLSAFSETFGIAMEAIGALPIDKKLILVGAAFTAFGSLNSFGLILWPKMRSSGITHHVYKLAISVAVVVAVLQVAAAVGDAFVQTTVNLTWVAAGLGVALVLAATIQAYFLLKDRPTFRWRRFLRSFTIQILPIGAFFSLPALGRAGGVLTTVF